MPELSRFFGIIITMYWSDHQPPHFHARYGDQEVTVEIATGRILKGTFSARARKLVQEWYLLHQAELQECWDLAQKDQPLKKIQPLD
ncbi:MAG: DUF4160 domain-containing protein [Puniceicoccales bacterium]|jgi:hypothetical protein|nr:DUF4160 domain-containing protein [Puniceicoccales bacterium]